jgi:hypothetical protein
VLRHRATQFDPLVVDAFVGVINRLGGAVLGLEDQASAQSALVTIAPFAVLQPAGSFPAPQADPTPSRANT